MTLDILRPYETLHDLPAGKLLFREGEPADGVYVLHSGGVALAFSNKPMVVLGPGEIVGLTTVMSNRAHDCSAVTHGACVVGFVEKAVFLRLLDEQPALWLTVLRMISENINACWQSMRALAVR
ncbi:MAG TPA: Crp/Fnr family transcriptional regulator [Thermoanaerobaculia bacterium]